MNITCLNYFEEKEFYFNNQHSPNQSCSYLLWNISLIPRTTYFSHHYFHNYENIIFLLLYYFYISTMFYSVV